MKLEIEKEGVLHLPSWVVGEFYDHLDRRLSKRKENLVFRGVDFDSVDFGLFGMSLISCSDAEYLDIRLDVDKLFARENDRFIPAARRKLKTVLEKSRISKTPIMQYVLFFDCRFFNCRIDAFGTVFDRCTFDGCRGRIEESNVTRSNFQNCMELIIHHSWVIDCDSLGATVDSHKNVLYGEEEEQ